MTLRLLLRSMDFTSSNWSLSTLLATVCSLVVISRIVKFSHALKAVDFLPGLRTLFAPLCIPALVLPETWWNPGPLFIWSWRKNRNIYHRYGCDTVSFAPFIAGPPTIYTRSMDVGKQIVVSGQISGAFGKSDAMGRFFLFWGPNVVSAEGELWRKHRRIASPAFNSETNTFVWEASRKLYMEMASVEGWDKKDAIEIPSVQTLTFKFTLIIFASVGFGFPFSWVNQPAHQGEMSIHECMEIIARTSVFAVAAPSWAWKLPFAWIRRVRLAYDTMRAFMHNRVSTTRESMRSQVEDDTSHRARDLFSLLVRASEDAGRKMGLNDNELIGNIFSFLFAGHDTTAHTLAATLAFLALDPNLQDELVAQVKELTQGRDDDTLIAEDYGKLDKVLAAFYEGIRMFPPGVFLVREAKHDTELDISDGGERRIICVKKGTSIVVDMVGVQYNARHFSDPEEFRPSRWYRKQQDSDGKDESEEYTAFSIGPRACLGRKFASVEGVCFLASLLRDWRIEPLLAMQRNGRVETANEWRGRVLQATMNVTLGIKDVPLKFVRRTCQ